MARFFGTIEFYEPGDVERIERLFVINAIKEEDKCNTLQSAILTKTAIIANVVTPQKIDTK